ncbi:unnamed protein product [Allacma fusca]|uniref:Uncharacterized protein n=1 Tax=Allacma fusca TaxID=39272 RepID=A0A8J2LT05_9HEXA|nr:unnamed protein product [Allacma fusca]
MFDGGGKTKSQEYDTTPVREDAQEIVATYCESTDTEATLLQHFHQICLEKTSSLKALELWWHTSAL